MAESESDESGSETGGNGTENGTNEDLSPERAYNLHQENGHSYREIAGMYGVSKSTVKRRVDTYREGFEAGKDAADPTDFDRDTLERALSDQVADDDGYVCECGSNLDYLQAECDNCGSKPNWGAL